MIYKYSDIRKYGDTFSITSKFADWIGNREWREGYDLLSKDGNHSNRFSSFWQYVSAVSEETGSEIYSKIKHFVQNIRDIDLCELQYLKAIAQELGYVGNLSYLDYDYPLEIYRLLNIFSINKDILFKTNKVLDIGSREIIYSATSAEVPSGIFSTFLTSAYSSEEYDRLITISGAPSGMYYTDDDAYQLLVDNVFTDCLSSFVNLLYKEDLSKTENQLLNGDFSQGLAGWSIPSSLTYTLSGEKLFYVYTPFDKHAYETSFNPVIGVGYTVSVDYEEVVVNSLPTSTTISFGGSNFSIPMTGNGTISQNITATTTDGLTILGGNNIFQLYDNISVYTERPLKIWENIAQTLIDDNIFEDNRSYDPDIEEAKVKYKIPSSFNEKIIVDNINSGIDSISNYTGPEQRVIQMEFDRREEFRTTFDLLSRYSAERENKVRRYFNFIDAFNMDSSDQFITYDLDPSYFEVSGEGSSLLTTNGTDYVLNSNNILVTAHKLRNIAFKVSYLREELKRLVYKHNLTGTELLVKILIKDLIRKYAYDQQNKWRYSVSGSDSITSATISENQNFDVQVVEYYDTTEYMNISTDLTPSGANDEMDAIGREHVHNRYWEDSQTKLGAISDTDIVDFYKEIVGVDLGVPDDQYADKLVDFLNKAYNYCATAERNITLSEEVSSLDASGTPFATDGTNRISNTWLEGDNWTVAGGSAVSATATTGYVLSATEDGLNYDYIYFDDIDRIAITQGGGSTSASFSMSATGTLEIGDIYMLELYGLRNDYASTLKMEITRTGGEIDLDASSSSGIVDIIAPLSAYLTPAPFFFPETTGVYERTQGLFVATTSAFSAYNLDITGMNSAASGSVYITSAMLYKVTSLGIGDTISYTYTDNGSGAFYRYTGQPEGNAPFANFKNSYHSSYAIHPYVFNMFEKSTDLNRIIGLINYDTETSAYIYLSGTIENRFDAFGNTVDSWREGNIENTGYTTYYEDDQNIDGNETANEYIAIDGPFNYMALADYLTSASAFYTNISGSEYYSILKLTDEEYAYIEDQLVRYESNIRSLSGKVIFKYTVDQYENNYMVYKDINDYSTSGELWIRKKDHPIAFPAFDLTNTNNASGAQLDISSHSNAGSYGDTVYDIGFYNNQLWMVCDNPITPVYLIGGISEITDPIENRPVLYYSKNALHNIETIPINNGYKYAGTAIINNVLNVAMVKSSTVSGLPQMENGYQINVRQELFDSDVFGRYTKSSNGILVKYNESTPAENTFRLQWTSSILSIAFESEAPTGQITNFVGYEESTGGTTTIGEVTGVSVINTFDNGITIVDLDLGNLSYGESVYRNSADEKGIHYFYGHSDLSHFSLYMGTSGKDEFYRYDSTRVPVEFFDFNNVDPDTDWSWFDFYYESERDPNTLNIQLYNDGSDVCMFEVISGLPMSATVGYITTDGSFTVPEIYIHCDAFDYRFNPLDYINKHEYLLEADLLVMDDVNEDDTLTPDDLLYTETGEVIMPDWYEYDWVVYSNFTFRVTDFVKRKLTIETSRPTWRRNYD